MSVDSSTPNAWAICVRSSLGVETLTSIFFLRAPCSASTLKANPFEAGVAVDVLLLRGELPVRGETGLGSILALLVEPKATRGTGGVALGGGLRFNLNEPGAGVGEVLDAAGLDESLGMLGGVGRGADEGMGGAVEFNTGLGALLVAMPFADALRRASASRSTSAVKGAAGPERSAEPLLEAPDDGSTLVGSERCGMPVDGIGGGGGAGPPLLAPNDEVGAPSGDLGPNGGGELTAGAPTFGGAFLGPIFAIPAFLGAFLGGGGGALADAAGPP